MKILSVCASNKNSFKHKKSTLKGDTNRATVTVGKDLAGGASGKEPTCQRRRHKRCRFNPRVEKIPWRRAWQPTPVFLPGGSHGQRSLVDYTGFQRVGHV